MKNGLLLQQRTVLPIIGLLFFFCLGVYPGHGAMAAEAGRVDLVFMEKTSKKATLPQVVFRHDKHTEVLGHDSCKSCHEPKKFGGQEGLDFGSFQKTAGLTGTEAKDAFHNGCLSCHQERASAGKPTGSLDASCRSCHSGDSKPVSGRAEMRFDKILHNTHILAASLQTAGEENNCARCHHIGVNPDTNAFVTKPGTEDGCFTCHMSAKDQATLLAQNPEAADDFGPIAKRMTGSAAAHLACVNCHMSVAAQAPAVKSGPVECAGCHDAAISKNYKPEESMAKQVENLRLDRKQPDAVLMFATSSSQEKQQGSMLPVSFNHKLHEGVVADCRSCHHQKIAACSSCHTLEGSKDGKFIPLEKAMHSMDSTRSCAGCHQQQIVKKQECAGCHVRMPQELGKASCATCHSMPAGLYSEQQATPLNLAAMSKEERASMASATIEERNNRSVSVVAQGDIPETVTIGILSKEFEPSVFPHRKIVNTLMAKTQENSLAAAFHKDGKTLCQGCHHNSPASLTPPRCVSCHAIDPQKAVAGVPALKAAYHIQCMTCHTHMNQKPAETDCNACHKPRVQ